VLHSLANRSKTASSAIPAPSSALSPRHPGRSCRSGGKSICQIAGCAERLVGNFISRHPGFLLLRRFDIIPFYRFTGVYMNKSIAPKLTIHASGHVRFIEVPSVRAEALLKFLRSRGISISPPCPHREGTDSIELGKGVQAETVQALLDQWA
jgi:hypothetical protein